MGRNFSSLSRTSGESDEKPSRVLFLLHRTWAIVVTDRWTKARLSTPPAMGADTISEFDTDYSFCSCRQCQRQDMSSDYSSVLFESRSIMAPNSEEGRRIGALRWNEEIQGKEKQRPPLYNPEDYATSVRKWARKHPTGAPNLYTSPSMNELDCPRSQNNSFKDYRNPMLSPAGSEMTLRQFGTVSELLSKLKADLRLAYPSFVQEFVSDPHDGVTLLLELLRAVQLSQGNNGNAPNGSSTTGRVPPSVQRRALLDELTCLQCLLCCCVRYNESIRRLAASPAGLYTLAVCIMSNVNKSRIIALQLLTNACEPVGTGHSAVSEAMSTLRLRFGEPVRFRFLVGMLTSAGGQGELLASGIKFINAFLDTSGTTQKRLYIQAELEQAGLDVAVIKKIISINSPSAELVFEELDHWEKHHIDVDTLTLRAEKAEKQSDYFRDKLLLLERRIQILQEEKGVLMSLEQCLKERCSELQDEVISLKSSGKSHHSRTIYHKKAESMPADDEGISSSERSLTPEDVHTDPSDYKMYTLQTTKIADKSETKLRADEEETTIDDVIQELKNIINDAEIEVYNKEENNSRNKPVDSKISNKIQMRVNCNVSMNDPLFDSENEIIPSNLQPQPPRRTRSLIHLYIPSEDYEYNSKEIFFENETPYTSDEGSDSLLSASKCHLPRLEKGSFIDKNSKTRISIHGKHGVKYSSTIRSVKKSESFHQVVPIIQTTEDPQNYKTIRHNSIDGFFVANYSEVVPVQTANSPLINQRINVEKALEEFAATEKIKSKSLDRIDDGLDTMVDIVLTSPRIFEQQSDSGHTTRTTLSQSTSNIFLSGSGKDFRISKLPSQKSEDNNKHKMFLPNQTSCENRDNEVHYYFPRVQEKCVSVSNSGNQSFLVKRGHANAGMYSGYEIIRSIRSSSNNSKKTDICVTKNRMNISAHGKVTDLPSGLY